MVSELVRQFANLPHPKYDDDYTDRLSSRYTVVTIVTFAVLVGLTGIVGKPITCWMPVHFHSSHRAYTNSFCWVRNTYYQSFDERVPAEDEHHEYISYYQWVPLILLVQASLFYLPSILWHGLNQKSGVDADNILHSSTRFCTAKSIMNKKKILTTMGNQFNRFLGALDEKKKTKKEQASDLSKFGQATRGISSTMDRFGSYLVCLYLVTKLLYIANVIIQLFLLNHLLDTDYTLYGINVLKWLLYEDVNQWTTSPDVAFPRVTLCDFRVRRLGNVHRYTVQCTLPINLYNEKIYMFLWFWMVFVAIVTVISFVQWLCRAVMVSDRKRYIRNHIKAGHAFDDVDNRENRLEEFVTKYLRLDGVFLLRLIGHNTNNITVTEIIVELWEKWNRQQDKLDKEETDSNDNDRPPIGEPSDGPGPLPEKSAPPLHDEDDDPTKSETLPLKSQY